jgi:O-antigen/teichoic acid export membrane protein
MLDRLHVLRASWTLVDQGLVSLGAFLVNVQLARQLAAEDYGTYALLLGGLLGLQLFNSSLLLYPMSIRLPVLQGPGKKQLQSATVLLVAVACIPLSAALAAGLFLLGRGDLILPALAMFLCWQMQETMRRGLLSEFRYSAAILGDATSYYGQVAAIAALSAMGELTLGHALEAMAVAYAVGAVIQAVQNRISFRQIANLRQTAGEFWSVGSWSLSNNLVSLLRIQILPWTLAAAGGAAAAALFQAALNVVNLTNPVILGLCNVIPQTAARAQQSGGNAEAWRASRIYMLMGVPPILGYYAVVFLVPGLVLRIFYGASSPYLALTLDLQILALAWAVSYATDMTCSYLHGVNGARFALIINMLGAIAVAVMALPLIQTYGLAAGCAALLGANLVRLAASYHIQRRITAHEYIAA